MNNFIKECIIGFNSNTSMDTSVLFSQSELYIFIETWTREQGKTHMYRKCKTHRKKKKLKEKNELINKLYDMFQL